MIFYMKKMLQQNICCRQKFEIKVGWLLAKKYLAIPSIILNGDSCDDSSPVQISSSKMFSFCICAVLPQSLWVTEC